MIQMDDNDYLLAESEIKRIKRENWFFPMNMMTTWCIQEFIAPFIFEE